VVTRRSVLLGATGVAAAAPLGGALLYATQSASAVDAAPVPDTLANRRANLTSSRVDEAGFPLSHLALSYTGPAAAVRLRTAAGWTGWQEVHTCAAGHDTRATRAVVLGATGAVGYEVKVGGGGVATALELNTVDGPRRAGAAATRSALPLPPVSGGPAAAGRLPVPPFLSRAAWGADESYRFDPDTGEVVAPPVFIPVQTLTVHHTGFDDDQPDPAATVRAIYYAQAVGNGWGDVGYHLFIDDAGRVYEGTYSDPDAVPVFGPDPVDGRPQMVNGAHVGGFNAGNVGVCLIGDFTARRPTAAARRSLTVVLAALSAVCGLNPTGTTNYVNPISGATATLATIPGHRDWNAANPAAGATECPGNTFYPDMPSVRRDVARLLRPLGLAR
jgi:hypothetical protein